MSLKKKTATLVIVCLLFLSTFTILARNFTITAQPSDYAELTSIIADSGKDTDSNSKYDYLDVSAEINVTEAGTYRVEANTLQDQFGLSYYTYAYGEDHLDIGISWLNLSFYGPSIYGAHFNPQNISWIDLYAVHEGYNEFLQEITNIQLSHIYNYTDFDYMASLTGAVYDQGIDADSDGLFDTLELGFEVDVLENATYSVNLSGLSGNMTYVPVYEYTAAFLTTGTQRINISVYGPQIFAQLSGSKGNVSEANYVMLRVEEADSYQIDLRYTMLLTRPYAYYEFESHAYFTGNIVDYGVDENGDGLFDLLKVEVEANITEAGSYEFAINGLKGVKNGSLETYYLYQSIEANLSKAVHMINFTIQGPMIAYNRFNPTNITGVRLTELPEYRTLNYTSCLDLPTRYNHTQFNAPLTDTELQFIVYPNATIDVNGTINKTHMYPSQDGPRINATVQVSTSGNVTTGTANGRFAFPDEDMWPFDSTDAVLMVEYADDVLNMQLNASVFMPPDALEASPFNSSSGDMTLTAAYTDGIVSIDLSGVAQLSPDMAAEFPFNVSDLRVVVEYMNERISGNATFHALGGFPLGDVTVYLDGNDTYLLLTGYVNVAYTNLFGEPVNETTVTHYIDFLTNFTGQGEQSLYNVTDGMMEFTSLDTLRTPNSPDPLTGERIDYNATLIGNFTGGLAKILVQMMGGPEEAEQTAYAAMNSIFTSIQNGTIQLNFYNTSKIVDLDLKLYCDAKQLLNDLIPTIPPTLPEEIASQVEAALKIMNASAYAINHADLKAVYSGDEQKLDLTLSMEANGTRLKEEALPIVPDAVPPEFQHAFEAFLNLTYCDLKTLNLSVNFTDNVGSFEADWTLEGDFKAEANHFKGFLAEFLNATGSGMPSWAFHFMNATELDVSNISFETEQGDDWFTATFSGVKLLPSRNDVDQIRFRLQDWLNLTDDPEAPPQNFERLRINVDGGFNGTHTVLLYAPGTVTAHFTGLDYKNMTWENTTLSGLKDLLFQIAYQGTINHIGNTYYIPVFTNSTVTNFSFNPTGSINFDITGESGTGFCNVTIPRSLLRANPSEWTVRVDGSPVTYNSTENSDYAFIYLSYSHSTHTIEITGTWVVTEYQPSLFVAILLTLALVTTIVAVKKRKKIAAVKTRYQASLRTFVAKMRRPNI